jgi:hypothetical protein
LQLPNSGDALKLLIPSYIRKAICGWTNNSDKVITQKMSENEMGYRGSKSDLIYRFVKEQRVDGSYFSVSIFDKLRCTLMDCESNYPVSSPSKLIILPTYKVQHMFLYRSF